MHKQRLFPVKNYFTFLLCVFIGGSVFGQQGPGSTDKIKEKLEQEIPLLMQQNMVPGLSAALIRDGKIVWQHVYGTINAETGKPATASTIWEAASLTKVVTAYAFLKLVDKGVMSLDTPLTRYLGTAYETGDDQRIQLITARHVLTHSTGFPNWRPRNSKTLPVNFDPGSKWSYSGEGFVYLARVMERFTKSPFQQLVQSTVFDPLDMKQSSLAWKGSFDSLKIYRHNWLGEASGMNDDKDVNAAASMHTTAVDYAKFMIALMNGTGLSKKIAASMLSEQFKANEKTPEVSWGLGVGMETTPAGKYFWHWGDQGDSKCFMTGDPGAKNGFVYFTNSANGLSFAAEILAAAGTGQHASVAMLAYPKTEPAAVAFFKDILKTGADTALRVYRESRAREKTSAISQSSINSIGYQLAGMGKLDEAIAVWKQNTTDFPAESNVWDSLAEGYMMNGDDQLAITNYEKAIELNPANSNAILMLKQLRAKK